MYSIRKGMFRLISYVDIITLTSMDNWRNKSTKECQNTLTGLDFKNNFLNIPS